MCDCGGQVTFIQFAMPPSGQCVRLVALERMQPTARQRKEERLHPKRPPGSPVLYQTAETRSTYLRQKSRPSPVPPRRERAAASLRERPAARGRNSLPTPYACQSPWCAHSPNKKSARKFRARQATARTPKIQTVVPPESGEETF